MFLILWTTQLQCSSDNKATRAQYPGGDAALNNYIQENLTYPRDAREKGVEGEVKMKIFINERGKIIAIRILESDDIRFEKPAVELIQSMPDWIPATDNKGVSVTTSKHLKVSFRLDVYA